MIYDVTVICCSILGGILLIGGLYCVLLGKSKEAAANKIQTVEDGTVRAEEK